MENIKGRGVCVCVRARNCSMKSKWPELPVGVIMGKKTWVYVYDPETKQ